MAGVQLLDKGIAENGPPKEIRLVHGERDAKQALAGVLRERYETKK